MDAVTHTPSHTCYSKGCRRDECRAAHRDYTRIRKRMRERPDGGPTFVRVSADEARAHLLALAARGIGLRQAAKVSGVSWETLRHVRNGERTFIRSDTRDRIFALHMGRLTPHKGKHPHKQPGFWAGRKDTDDSREGRSRTHVA